MLFHKTYQLGENTPVLREQLEKSYYFRQKGDNRYFLYKKLAYLDSGKMDVIVLDVRFAGGTVHCYARPSVVSLVFLAVTLLVPLYVLWCVITGRANGLILLFSCLLPILPAASIVWQTSVCLSHFTDTVQSVQKD